MNRNTPTADPVVQICEFLCKTVVLGYTEIAAWAFVICAIRVKWLLAIMDFPPDPTPACPLIHEVHKDKINRIREHLGQSAEPAPHRKYQAEPATKAEWDPYIQFLELEHAEGRLRKYTVDQPPSWLTAYTDSKTIIFETDDLRVAFRDERPRFQVLSCTMLNLRTGEVMEKQCLEQGGIMPSTDC